MAFNTRKNSTGSQSTERSAKEDFEEGKEQAALWLMDSERSMGRKPKKMGYGRQSLQVAGNGYRVGGNGA